MDGFTVATGNTALVALGPELRPGMPAGPDEMTAYVLIPSANLDLEEAENESGEASGALGMVESVPGAIGGNDLEFTTRFAAPVILPLLAHLFGSVTKTEVETGVFEYVLTPTTSPTVSPTLAALVAKEPVERHWLQLAVLSMFSIEVGDNEEVGAKFAAMAARHSDLGWAAPDGTNSGTYPHAPIFRGPVRDPAAGPVAVQITSTAPLRYRVAQGAAPAWSGPEIQPRIDERGFSRFEVCRGDDGQDLGIVVGDNWNPLEVVFPGKAADHALLAVGDTWTAEAPGAWVAPTIARVLGGRLLSAHWTIELRDSGSADPWVEISVESGSIELGQNAVRQPGSGSRGAQAILRKPPFTLSMEVENKLVTDAMKQRHRLRRRMDTRLSFFGAQVGASGDYREGVQILAPYVGIGSRDAEIGDVEELTETVAMMAYDPPSGAPPFTCRIVTDRDWTPPTYLV